MDNRCIRKQLRLTEEEASLLLKKSSQAGMKEGPFLRSLLESSVIKEKPDDRFYEVMKQMRLIGNNLNQIAAKANALNFVDVPYYKEEAKKWNQFMLDVKKEFLINDK